MTIKFTNVHIICTKAKRKPLSSDKVKMPRPKTETFYYFSRVHCPSAVVYENMQKKLVSDNLRTGTHKVFLVFSFIYRIVTNSPFP